MIKILAMADLHLSTPRGELKRFGIEDPLKAIESLKETVTKEKPEVLIVAGDIFNGVKVDSTEIYLFSEFLKAVAPIGVKYSIKGNHDRGTHSIPEVVSDFIELNEEPRSILGDVRTKKVPPANDLTISGLSFKDIDSHREFLKTATSDILVVHFPMSPFNSFGENISAEECPENKLVIVGDTHVGEVYLKNNRCVVSPGCLFPSNKEELCSGKAGTSYMILLDKDPDGELLVDLRQICFRKRFGASLTRLSDRVGVLHAIDTIDVRNAVLKPVAYIDASIDVEKEGWDIIPVRQVAGEDASVEFSGLEGGSVDERIRSILGKLYSDDPNKDRLTEFSMNLIKTDSPETVIEEALV